MPKRRSRKAESVSNSGHGKNWLLIGGIVMILIGLAVWNEQYLSLSQAFAILFVLMGVKKLMWAKHC